jgi:hypothetical protein
VVWARLWRRAARAFYGVDWRVGGGCWGMQGAEMGHSVERSPGLRLAAGHRRMLLPLTLQEFVFDNG